MNIALDLDNVLIDIMGSAKRILARELGVPVHEIIDTGIYGAPFTHANPAIADQIKTDHAFWSRHDVLAQSCPLPGAVDAANRLHQAGQLGCYITRRPPAVAKITAASLKDHAFPDRPICHVGHTEPKRNYAMCKSTACRDHAITHMIDDHVGEARTLKEAGIAVFLIDAPTRRDERRQFLAAYPSTPVAPDVSSAVDVLLRAAATECSK